MGTKVQCESYLPGYYSMRDPNEGSSSSNWPLLCGDKSIANGQYQNGYLARTFPNSYPGGDKDAVKQKMLEQDAVFQHQVIELHRLYNTQKDLMGEIKRIELHKQRMMIETSSLSGPLMSQKSKFAYLNPNPGIEMNSPPLSSARGNINQVSERFLAQNGCSSKKDYEVSEVRPSKVRKKLFDLQLPPNEDVVDPEEDGRAHNKFLEVSSRNHRLSSPVMDTVSKYNKETTYISSSRLRNPAVGLADLNEPVQLEEPSHPHFLLGLSKEVLKNNPQHPTGKGISSSLHIENRGSGKDRLFYTTHQGYNKTNMNIISQDAQRDSSLVSHKPLENAALDKYHHPSTVNGFAHVTIDYLRERLEASSRDPCNLHHLKPVSTFANKMASIQTPHPHLNPLATSNTSSQSPAQQSQEISKRGPLLPSWIKDPSACFPLTGFENSNSNKYANERSINYSPCKMAKDVNLNLRPPSKNPCIEIVDVEKDYVDQTKVVLPWLKTETLKRSNQYPPPDNKIFGVPIFAQSSCTSITNDWSSLASTSAPLKDKGKRLMIDMNIACDIECGREIAKESSPPPIIEKSVCEREKEPLFDLNTVGSEDETAAVALVLPPSTVSTNNNERIMIDLEMPPVPESDEEEDVLAPPVPESDKEEVLIAAEAMMAISSYLTITNIPPSPGPLLWFAQVVSSLVGGFENLEIDEFEAATLNLREMPEEEYMPKALEEDENASFEKGGGGASSSSARGGGRTTRRGGGRRGTRKRDFQRDILPGLVSLSRHEVSEDIQALGLTRRNRNRGGGRGRRRVTVDPPVDDVAETAAVCPPLTEAANIWGETPRRPRRQRGNSQQVHLA